MTCCTVTSSRYTYIKRFHRDTHVFFLLPFRPAFLFVLPIIQQLIRGGVGGLEFRQGGQKVKLDHGHTFLKAMKRGAVVVRGSAHTSAEKGKIAPAVERFLVRSKPTLAPILTAAALCKAQEMRATRGKSKPGALSLAIVSNTRSVFMATEHRPLDHKCTPHAFILCLLGLKVPSRAVAVALSHHTGRTKPCAHHHRRSSQCHVLAVSSTEPPRKQNLNKHTLLILASTHRPP